MHKVLVDDDASTLRALRQLLGGQGYEVTTLTDPLRALGEVRRSNFDAIISDIRMPEMDGVNLIRECRKLRPNMGMVLMTAYPEPGSAFEAGRHGVIDYVTKPIDPQRLSQAIARAVLAKTRPLEKRSMRGRRRPSLRALHLSPSKVARLPLVKVYGLGEARVVVGDREVRSHVWQGQKAKELLFFLLSQWAKHHKEEIIEALWPDRPLKADKAFHSAAYRLRQAVHPDYLLHTEKSYWLNPHMPYWYDVEEFRRQFGQAEWMPPGPEQAAKLNDALALYRGPFLTEFYSEWRAELARELEMEYIKALMLLAECHETQSQFSEVAPLMEKLLKVDPYNDDAVRRLMQSYVRLGQPDLVGHCYRQYERLLREELDTKPAARLIRLYHSIEDGDPRSP